MTQPEFHHRLHQAAEQQRPTLTTQDGRRKYTLTGTSVNLQTGMLTLRLEPDLPGEGALMLLHGLKLPAWGDPKFISDLERWLASAGFTEIKNLRWAELEHQGAGLAELDFDPAN